MNYYVSLAGRTFEVDLSGGGVRVDGQSVSADLKHDPGSAAGHLLMDDASLAFVAQRTDGAGREWELHAGGARYEVEVVDERTRAIRAMTGAGAAARGPAPVRAPMPGLVTRVEVEEGESVQAGQGVAIIEAMKMENELRAEADGVVARVLVAAGEPVDKGAVLVEFEVPEEA